MEVFDDSDKVSADVVLLPGYPQSCMPNPVEGLLEVYDDMVEMSCWCWRYFLERISKLKICSVVFLPALKPACSSAIFFSAFGSSLFSMIFSMLSSPSFKRMFYLFIYCIYMIVHVNVCHGRAGSVSPKKASFDRVVLLKLIYP